MSDIIPCLAILAFLVPVFALIVIMRYINYRETLALAEKGLVHPQKQRDGKDTLRWGIVITAVGLALCVGLWPIGFIPGIGTYPLGLGPWMLVGIVPTFIGLALILVYVLTYDRQKPGTAASLAEPAERENEVEVTQ
jgi:hypothetical protein